MAKVSLVGNGTSNKRNPLLDLSYSGNTANIPDRAKIGSELPEAGSQAYPYSGSGRIDYPYPGKETTYPGQYAKNDWGESKTYHESTAGGASGTGQPAESPSYGAAGAGSGNAQTPGTGSSPSAGSIMSYEDYLKSQQESYRNDYEKTLKYYEDQNVAETERINAEKAAAEAEAEKQRQMLLEATEKARNTAYTAAEKQLMSDLNYTETQYQALLDAINKERESGAAMAQEKYDTLMRMSEEQRDAIYKAAEEQYRSDIAYADSEYKSLIDAINAEKESGTAMAEEKRQLLLDMSQKQRNAIYAAAEAQREQEYVNAEVERERGVVDARSSYAQSRASYGANAEALASMGLSGSGYGEYMDSVAYAQQRAETQQANAQSEASKRQARYTENQQKLSADQEHAQNQYNAESQYLQDKYSIDTSYRENMRNADREYASGKKSAEDARRQTELSADQNHQQNRYNAESQLVQDKYDVDSTYRSNMLQAEQERASGKKTAEDQERQTKYEADQKFDSNSYAANSAYSSSMREADQNARNDKAAADKEASAGKLTADLNYSSNIRGLEDKAQERKQNEKEYARSAYYEILDKVNSGAYTENQVNQLAKDFGLSEEQTKSLIDAANAYANKENTGDANTYNNYKQMKDDIENQTDEDIEKATKAGLITKEDGEALKNSRDEAIGSQVQDFMDDGGDKQTSMGYLDKAYSEGRLSKEAYQKWYFKAIISDYEDKDGSVTPDDVFGREKELKYAFESGKISAADYRAGLKYMYSSAGKSLNRESYEIQNNYAHSTSMSKLTMNGKNYTLAVDIWHAVDNDTQKALASIAGTTDDGTLVDFGGQIYIYRKLGNSYSGDGWYKVKQGGAGIGATSSGFYEDFREACKGQTTSAPDHAATDIDTSYKNNSGEYTQSVNPTGKSSDFLAIQEYINGGNFREGDRTRWGQAFRSGRLPDGRNVLDVYNSLSDDEKKALKGTTSKQSK